MKFLISFLHILPMRMLNSKFGENWSASSGEEDVNVPRTTDDYRRRPIAICHVDHLSVSGDLRIEIRIELSTSSFNPTHTQSQLNIIYFVALWPFKTSGLKVAFIL